MGALPAMLRQVEAQGHAVFTNEHRNGERKGFNLNLIGERTKSREPGAFDDLLYVWWVERGRWESRVYPITTDPGLFYLENPLRREGTAILAPGQYRGAWKLGLHKGRYEALVQQKPVDVFRDGNRDERLDPVGDVHTGMFGINIHRAHEARVTGDVGRWSAGCQVFKDPNHFHEFMRLCRIAANLWGNSFTYTLLEER